MRVMSFPMTVDDAPLDPISSVGLIELQNIISSLSLYVPSHDLAASLA